MPSVEASASKSRRIALAYPTLFLLSEQLVHGNSNVSRTLFNLFKKHNPSDTLLSKIYSDANKEEQDQLEYLLARCPKSVLFPLLGLGTPNDHTPIFNDKKTYRKAFIKGFLEDYPHAILFPKNKRFLDVIKTAKWLQNQTTCKDNHKTLYNLFREVILYSEITIDTELFNLMIDTYNARTNLSVAPFIPLYSAVWSINCPADIIQPSANTWAASLGFDPNETYRGTYFAAKVGKTLKEKIKNIQAIPLFPNSNYQYYITNKIQYREGQYHVVVNTSSIGDATWPKQGVDGIQAVHIFCPPSFKFSKDFRHSSVYTKNKHLHRAFATVETNEITKPDFPQPEKWLNEKLDKLEERDLYNETTYPKENDCLPKYWEAWEKDLATWRTKQNKPLIDKKNIKQAFDLLTDDSIITPRDFVTIESWQQKVGDKVRTLSAAKGDLNDILAIYARAAQIIFTKIDKEIFNYRLANYIPDTWWGAPEQLIKFRQAYYKTKNIDVMSYDIKDCYNNTNLSNPNTLAAIEESINLLRDLNYNEEADLLHRICEIFLARVHNHLPTQSLLLGLPTSPYILTLILLAPLYKIELLRRKANFEYTQCGDDFLAVFNSKDAQQEVQDIWTDVSTKLNYKFHHFKELKKRGSIKNTTPLWENFPRGRLPLKHAGLTFYKGRVIADNLGIQILMNKITIPRTVGSWVGKSSIISEVRRIKDLHSNSSHISQANKYSLAGAERYLLNKVPTLGLLEPQMFTGTRVYNPTTNDLKGDTRAYELLAANTLPIACTKSLFNYQTLLEDKRFDDIKEFLYSNINDYVKQALPVNFKHKLRTTLSDTERLLLYRITVENFDIRLLGKKFREANSLNRIESIGLFLNNSLDWFNIHRYASNLIYSTHKYGRFHKEADLATLPITYYYHQEFTKAKQSPFPYDLDFKYKIPSLRFSVFNTDNKLVMSTGALSFDPENEFELNRELIKLNSKNKIHFLKKYIQRLSSKHHARNLAKLCLGLMVNKDSTPKTKTQLIKEIEHKHSKLKEYALKALSKEGVCFEDNTSEDRIAA